MARRDELPRRDTHLATFLVVTEQPLECLGERRGVAGWHTQPGPVALGIACHLAGTVSEYHRDAARHRFQGGERETALLAREVRGQDVDI